MRRYGERDYTLTQNIGAALAFLGLDGLIAPSARWPCDNLMIYQSNHTQLTERLEVIEEEQVNWVLGRALTVCLHRNQLSRG